MLPGDLPRRGRRQHRQVNRRRNRRIHVEQPLVERDPGDRGRRALRRAVKHLQHARIAPLGDHPAVMRNHPTGAGSGQQRAEDFAVGLIGHLLRQITVHVLDATRHPLTLLERRLLDTPQLTRDARPVVGCWDPPRTERPGQLIHDRNASHATVITPDSSR